MVRKTILVFFNTTVQFHSLLLVSPLVQVPVWSCSPSRPCTTPVTCLMPVGHVFNISPRVTFVVLGDDILCFYVHTGHVHLIVFTRPSRFPYYLHPLLRTRQATRP